MKQFASAILIFILLFNVFGYKFVGDYLGKKYDTQLEARLDKGHYNELELIELKIPLNLAYQTSWSEFERYNGEVEINGILYKYVKRKVTNDTLVLMCIPNHQKMNLQTANDDFFKNTNDLAQNDKSKKPGNSKAISFKKLMAEYDEQPSRFNTNLTCNFYEDSRFNYIVENLASSCHISPEQPPDRICV